MKLLLSILLLLLVGQGFAQEKIFIHPEEDPHWEAVVYETFDSTFDKSIWRSYPPFGPSDTASTCDVNDTDDVVTNFDYLAAQTKEFQNVSVDTGVLNIQTRREQYLGERWKYHRIPDTTTTDPNDSIAILVEDSVMFNYTTGMLFSHDLFKYGYFEIKCKLPEPPQNDLDRYAGLGPNFWLWSQGQNRYSEIDIFEILSHNPNDLDGQPNNWFTHNFHFLCDSLPDCPTDSFIHGKFDADWFNINFNQFKTFSSYWSEESIDYYYEDSILHTSSLFPEIKIDTTPWDGDDYHNDFTVNDYKFNNSRNFYPMHIIVDIYVPGRQFCVHQTDSTQMPYDYLVDHVKVWQLKNACDSNLVIADIDPFTYDFTVKQSINLGNGGGTLSNGEDLILRANESITLEAGYGAVLGSELTLIISDCMEDGGVFPSSNPGGLKNAPENVTPIPYPRPNFFPINY